MHLAGFGRWGMTLVVLAVLALQARAESQEALARKAHAILKNHCHRCHGKDGSIEGGMNYVLDLPKLVQRRKVIPGKADQSPLFKKVINNQMPPAKVKKRLTEAEKNTLRQWIDTGAKGIQVVEKRVPIREKDVQTYILADLKTIEKRSRRFTRYFSLAHLYNAGLGEDELQTYRNALSKLINSLSWHPRVSVPRTVDPKGTVLRIDLRWYMWDANLWNRLLEDYPYGIFLNTATARVNAVSTATRMPVLRGDWFIATASRAPLYYDMLLMPTSLAELERELRIDAAINILQERVARAGFNGSGVSQNNRILERHDSVHGAYWRTYDFNAIEQNLVERENLLPDQKNIFAYPLGPAGVSGNQNSFLHAGGEVIFSLPNGLHAYLLVNANGVRINKAPTPIVSDPRRPDRAVEAGLSCMSCHFQGINQKDDQVREFVTKNPKAFSRADADLIKALYVPRKKMQALMQADMDDYRKAVEKTGTRISATETITAMVQRYEADLDLPTAASELSLTPEEFLQKMTDSSLVARNFGSLRVDGGTVQREVVIQAFGDLIRDLKLGQLFQPDQIGEQLPDNTGEIDPLEGQSSEANSMVFSPDGKFALFGSSDKTVRLWDFDARREIKRFIGHRASVWSVAISPNSKWALSGSADKSIRYWNIATGQEVRRLAGHTDVVSSLAFSPDGKQALSAGFDQSVILWDVKTGKEMRHYDSSDFVHCLSFMPDGWHALLGIGKNLVVWNLRNGKQEAVLEGHTDSIVSLAIAPDGKHVLSGGDDGAVRLWDVKCGCLKRVFTGHKGPVPSVSFSSDGKQAVTGGGDTVLRVWDVGTGKQLSSFPRHQETVICVALTDDGSYTISGSTDADIRFWKVPGVK